MNREEFTQLSKVEVTLAYYEKIIEPDYMGRECPKETFVNQWLTENKKDIVKAHSTDIARASYQLAIQDCHKADLERIRAENIRLQQQAKQWENKFEFANCAQQESEHMAETWKADCERLEPLLKKVSDLEAEVVRLKARLFDMLEQQSA